MPLILTLSAVPKTMDKAKEALEKIQLGELQPHPDYHSRIMGLLQHVASGLAEVDLAKTESASHLIDLDISRAAALVRESIEYLTQKEIELLNLALPCSLAKNLLSAKQELYHVLIQIESPVQDIQF